MVQEQAAHDVEAALKTAIRLHQGGSIAEAADRYDEILRTTPDQPDALYLRGTVAAQEGDHDGAVALIRRAIDAAPRVPAYHNNLGIVLRAKAAWDEAAASFRRALVLNPRYPEALANLGATLYTLDQMEESIASYKKALDIQPGLDQAMMEMACIFFEGGEFEGTAELLRHAAGSGPQTRGYADSCVVGQPFEELTRPDRLASALDGLPAVEGAFPDARPDAGLTVMIACDQSYFTEYGRAFALSLDRNSPHRRLHVHLFDPGPEAEHEIAELSSRLTTTQLSVTHERTDGVGIEYFANVRFARLYQLYEACGTDVLCLDTDCLILGDLSAIEEVARDTDIAAPTRLHVPELQNKIRADAVFVRRTDRGRAFLGRMAAYLAGCANEGRLHWWLDQCALYITWRMMEFHGTPVSMASFDASIIGPSPEPKPAIWVAKGITGKTDEVFMAAQARLLRGEPI